MILIGQYDSPFVRRVAVALELWGVDFDHRPWSVWADADQLAAFNPMRRVPTLVLDDGEVLIESSAILDALDEMVGPARAMLPGAGPERRRGTPWQRLSLGQEQNSSRFVHRSQAQYSVQRRRHACGRWHCSSSMKKRERPRISLPKRETGRSKDATNH